MWRIPLSDLNYDAAEEQAVLEVVRSRWLSMGPKTEEFEARAAEYLGVKYALGVANCTCALHLAYEFVMSTRAFPPGNGPAVLVPNITFVATASAAVKCGARPLLLDIESLDRPMISTRAVTETIQRLGSGIAALTVMHYGGFDAGVEKFVEEAAHTGIPVVEDAAHAIGGKTASGKALGAAGAMGCFSFFANKNVATGEGGLIATNSDEIATAVRLLRSHGMTSLTHDRHRSRRHGYDVITVGHNFRCNEIMAALGIEQLKKLNSGNRRRRELFRLYIDGLKDNEAVRVPLVSSQQDVQNSACHVFALLCRSPQVRDEVRAALTEAGVQSSHHYPPLHTLSAYRELMARGGTAIPIPNMKALGNDFPSDPKCRDSRFPFPVSTHFSAREITLPLHPRLKNDEVAEICDLINRTTKSL